MIWVDQTLAEGMRISMNKGNVNSVVELLQNLQVGMIDISVTAWKNYGLPRMNQQQLRGKVSGSVGEVELANQLGLENIAVACTLKPGDGLPDQIRCALLTAQKLSMNIALCIENASNFSIEDIEGLWRDVSTMGVTTFIYSDGNSLLNPLSTFKLLTAMAERIPVSLEFHPHNAYGLATANALGAMEAGVQRIATAVAGVGAQGHAALEEMIMIQKRLRGEETVATVELSPRCSQIIRLIGLELSTTKAIIGQDIFAHESGIHVDGVLKNPQLYEAFPPEEVGLTRKLIIGKHSGTASIQAKFQERNIVLSASDAQYLLKKVRKLAVLSKKTVDDDTLWKIYQDRVV